MRSAPTIALFLLVAPSVAVSAGAQDSLSASQRAVFAQYEIEKAECFSKLGRGEITMLRILLLCVNTARIKAMGAAGYPYMDLEYLMADQKIAIATRLDAHQITEQEATMLSRDIEARINAEAIQRARKDGEELARDQVRSYGRAMAAQAQANAESRIRAIEALNGLLSPAPTGSPPTATTCQWLGPQLQCTTR
jgi:hypothetical protein